MTPPYLASATPPRMSHNSHRGLRTWPFPFPSSSVLPGATRCNISRCMYRTRAYERCMCVRPCMHVDSLPGLCMSVGGLVDTFNHRYKRCAAPHKRAIMRPMTAMHPAGGGHQPSRARVRGGECFFETVATPATQSPNPQTQQHAPRHKSGNQAGRGTKPCQGKRAKPPGESARCMECDEGWLAESVANGAQTSEAMPRPLTYPLTTETTPPPHWAREPPTPLLSDTTWRECCRATPREARHCINQRCLLSEHSPAT